MQAYATKEYGYEDYAPAYRVGYEGAAKHRGKAFEEVEDELALDYSKHQPGSTLPWDQAPHCEQGGPGRK